MNHLQNQGVGEGGHALLALRQHETRPKVLCKFLAGFKAGFWPVTLFISCMLPTSSP